MVDRAQPQRFRLIAPRITVCIEMNEMTPIFAHGDPKAMLIMFFGVPLRFSLSASSLFAFGHGLINAADSKSGPSFMSLFVLWCFATLRLRAFALNRPKLDFQITPRILISHCEKARRVQTR
jgi:hypothetical protein